MRNKSKLYSDLSKVFLNAMGTFSSFKKEIETIVKLRVEKIIKNMNLVKRDEFEALKKTVQNTALNQKKSTKKSKKNK